MCIRDRYQRRVRAPQDPLMPYAQPPSFVPAAVDPNMAMFSVQHIPSSSPGKHYSLPSSAPPQRGNRRGSAYRGRARGNPRGRRGSPRRRGGRRRGDSKNLTWQQKATFDK
eukprot:TRINITY_DN2346_c0_g1_i2.p1 TRINITY_DN2346_c0_g1~~TRINITY_DN2346_c0_g1_i2.p1  ORF type:complete len:111 (-),score=9.72 TRINITY_DN2346_c0_g1_i2:41-373(-)